MDEVLGDQLSVGQGGVLIGGGQVAGPEACFCFLACWFWGFRPLPSTWVPQGVQAVRLGLAILSHAPPSPAQFVFVFLSEGAAPWFGACLLAGRTLYPSP